MALRASSVPLNAAAFVCLLALATNCGGLAGEPDAARLVRQVDWAGAGTWIKAETHVHTRFSDGGHTVDEVVTRAIEYGARVVAITDHGDENLGGASPEYAEAIAAARQAHPEILVVAGLEWNIPPWDGQEHATVLMPAGPNEWDVLAELKARFDDYHREEGDTPDVGEALAWLAARGVENGVRPVVLYNHPSRADADSVENIDDIRRWRDVNDLVIGFEGAPGHQGLTPIGSYGYSETTIDRWDPVAARVGDAWDVLLQEGHDVWAAHASSDFHSEADLWPGQFSETWLYVPEPTVAGVLRAMRAGAAFGAHGHIARDVELTVLAEGLDRPAMVGEVIEAPEGSTVTARLSFDVPSADWLGAPNQIDEVELIGITQAGATVIASGAPASGPVQLTETLTVPDGGLVLRARGRRVVPDGPDLMFYTNPIRIRAY